MEVETRKVMARLNPHFARFKEPVRALSGGQRQAVAIARAIHFNARVLIMDEPTAALGPQETQQVADLIVQLKKEGIGIFLISHDIHDVFDLADRVAVMKNGRLVGTARDARRHQGRGAGHDHPRDMSARRRSRPGGGCRAGRLKDTNVSVIAIEDQCGYITTMETIGRSLRLPAETAGRHPRRPR